jgi:hypothetical protein
VQNSIKFTLCFRLVDITGTSSRVPEANVTKIKLVNATINAEFGMYTGSPSSESDSDHSEDSSISRLVNMMFQYTEYSMFVCMSILLSSYLVTS